MLKRRIAGAGVVILVAVVASAFVVSRFAAGQESEPKSGPPTNALTGSQISNSTMGTPVSSLTLPAEFGELHILPVGSSPHPAADPVPPKSGLTVTRVDRADYATAADCAKSTLSVTPAYIPSGWKQAGCSGETIVWSDGETTDSTFAARYARTGSYPLVVGRRLLAPGDYADVVNDDGSAFALSVVDLAGTQAVVRHQAPNAAHRLNGPFEVTFVQNGVVSEIEAAGIEPAELVKVAAGLAASNRSN